jgi:uncharacterized membrane protein
MRPQQRRPACEEGAGTAENRLTLAVLAFVVAGVTNCWVLLAAGLAASIAAYEIIDARIKPRVFAIARGA